MSESDRSAPMHGNPPHRGLERVGLAGRLQAALAGRYSIEGELGQGGMGVVFLARDLKHGRRVAVKVLPPELAHSLGAERFLREIRTTARLTHPHVLALHDSGEADGLLYYVMPFVEGESLDERLAREGPLPVDEALRIACEVADALAEAHSLGVVHRDIKPGNILLSGGRHVCVADFGLARAVFSASNRRLTATGVAIGSPSYMSPEQIEEGEKVDARSDLYSLGCVLYEMLAGRPPFDGASVQSVLSGHLLERPAPLRSLRPEIPPPVTGIVRRLLAKSPGERPQSAAELRDELRAVSANGSGSARVAVNERLPLRRTERMKRLFGGRRKYAAVAGVVAVLVALGLLVGQAGLPFRSGPADGGEALDSLRYAILPFRQILEERESGGAGIQAGAGNQAGLSGFDVGPLREDLHLYNALSYWEGIEVEDPIETVNAIRELDAAELSLARARVLATELGVGRYIWGTVDAVRGGHRIYAALYDANSGQRLRDATLEVQAARSGAPENADSLFARLADSLLFDLGGIAGEFSGRSDTRSFSAAQNYIRARSALEEWDLAAADSLLRVAVRADPEYMQANLWLAQTRNWAGMPVDEWSRFADRVLGRRDRLPPREALVANGLSHLSRGEFPAACESYDSLVALDNQDFAGWFGRGECRRLDDVVLTDGSSPSGYSFRGSAHSAAQAYAHAFSLLPSAHNWLQSERYGWVRELLFTSPQQLRRGFHQGRSFLAYPAWVADTLTFIPRHSYSFSAGDPETVPSSILDAVRHQRELFHELAQSWVNAFPDSPDALEGLSLSLEMLADPEAIGAIRRARLEAPDERRKLDLAASEVWLLVRFGTPDEPERLRNARALGDSILDRLTVEARVNSGASIAALLGRPHIAARLARANPPNMTGLPARIRAPASALLAYAAFGLPGDSIRSLAAEVEEIVRHTLPSDRQPGARQHILARAKVLSLPAGQQDAFAKFDFDSSWYLLEAAEAYLEGDTAEVHSMLERVREARRLIGPLGVSMDALYPEAWLLQAIGEEREAAEWLDSALEELRWVPLNANSEPAAAAALLRAMQLRVELAEQSGDSTAGRRWAEPLSILWSHPDSLL